MGTMKQTISQYQLDELYMLERSIEATKRRLKGLLEQHELKEAPVMAALLEGRADVESGRLSVELDWSHRRSPDYKAWIDKEHGVGTAAKILEATKPTDTPFLVIEVRA